MSLEFIGIFGGRQYECKRIGNRKSKQTKSHNIMNNYF